MKSMTIVVLLGLVAVAMCAPEHDLVEEMPGIPKFEYPVYSGLLAIKGENRRLHYIFVQS